MTKVKPIYILMKQETTGYQWHQLDHYANHLHLTLDRSPCQHFITQIFTNRMVILMPNQHCPSTEDNIVVSTPVCLKIN